MNKYESMNKRVNKKEANKTSKAKFNEVSTFIERFPSYQSYHPNVHILKMQVFIKGCFLRKQIKCHGNNTIFDPENISYSTFSQSEAIVN